MKSIKKGKNYTLLEVKENFLIVRGGVVYFSILKKEITEHSMNEVFKSYDEDSEFMQVLVEEYSRLCEI